LVEQRTENPRVGGSSPPPGTTFFSNFLDPRTVSHVSVAHVIMFIDNKIFRSRLARPSITNNPIWLNATLPANGAFAVP
jgi:hypothetical protein